MVGKGLWTALIIGILLGKGLLGDEPPLPKPIGAINDYAAALGPKSRKELDALIGRLRTEGIEVRLLITLLDPYSDPKLLSQRLWEEWGLSSKGTVLLLFVREEDRWRFHWRASPDLAPRLSNKAAWKHREAIQALLIQRRVAQAARRAVSALSDLLGGSGETEATAPQRGTSRLFQSRWVGYGLGAIAAVGLMIGLIRWALVWLCPECGSRLKRESGRAFGFGYGSWVRGRRTRRNWVYYCRRCGWWGER